MEGLTVENVPPSEALRHSLLIKRPVGTVAVRPLRSVILDMARLGRRTRGGREIRRALRR